MQMKEMKMIITLLSCCILFGWSLSVSGENTLEMANKHFALDLYRQITKENQGKNVFFSPISISAAFGMLFLGARGNTRRQLISTLHFSEVSGDDAINDAFRKLLLALRNHDSNHTLHMANRLFGSNEFQFRDDFLQISQNIFQASLERLDFKRDSSGSTRHINDWVAEETNQKIKNLLPDGILDASTILVMVNAIYFKAFWETPFDKKSTRSTRFHISTTEQVNISMMFNREIDLNYYDSTELDCEVVELPYLGGKTSMFIFLPHAVDGLSKLEMQLTTDKLNEMLGKLGEKSVNLNFPKFTMDLNLSLKQYLQSLGMLDPFDVAKCDLSGIGNGRKRLVVDDAIHKAFVTVNEIGTEAGAATAIRISLLSMKYPIEVNANRPFLFLILEKDTKTILFLGRLVRPPVEGDSIGKFGETAKLTSGNSNQLASGKVFILLKSVTLFLISLLLQLQY